MHPVMADSTRVIHNESSSMNQECYTNQAMVSFHNDVIKWKQFPRSWLFVRGNHRCPGWAFLLDAWTNGWAKKRNAGDLRRHHAQYDVTVMLQRIVKAAVMVVAFKQDM